MHDTTDATAAKKAIRANVRALRAQIAPADRAAKSAIIYDRLWRFVDAHRTPPHIVGVYSAFADEVDLHDFIARCYGAGIQVAFPCMDLKTNLTQPMYMREVAETDYAQGNAPFVTKPLARFAPDAEELHDFPVVAPEAINLLVTPLVAFDDANKRLGYGGGNYDRYLPLLAPGTPVFGVAFAEQRIDHIPCEAHDKPLDIVVWA